MKAVSQDELGGPEVPKIAVGTVVAAAADTLARELAPIRVNAGVIDTGVWDDFGEQGKVGLLRRRQRPQPRPAHRHHRRPMANSVVFALTSTSLTGQTLHIDGGEPLT
jgi:NAD(P)-dependent dehydrogenase (short-subunit alcohol dehydrogenase family)